MFKKVILSKVNIILNKFNIILSPFFERDSFEFYLQNSYNKKIITNDKFTLLYNF